MASRNLRLAALASNVDISGAYTQAAGITVYNTAGELPLSGNEAGDMAFVDSSDKLYLYSGEGWYNIALVNQTPTITSGGDASYDFEIDGTPIVITLVASDPEGIPLTWSYAVTSGTLGNTATVSQADNVFTITPSTDAENAGEFSITFTASDGVNLATSVSSFTLSFGAADQYYYKNSLLLKSGSTAGLNNHTFVDESTNGLTVTRNGDVYQGSYSPYSPIVAPSYSAYFDGTGDYATVADYAGLTVGTNFTAECWVYVTNQSVGNQGILGQWKSGPGRSWLIAVTDTAISLTLGSGSFYPGVGATGSFVNQWVHIAYVKTGTTNTLYVNGVSAGTVTDVNPNASTDILIIGGNNDSASVVWNFNGYISDVRIVQDAVYTSNFTPPTEPLTAIANTSLLTLNSISFVDSSTNNVTVNRYGNTTAVLYSPYPPVEVNKYDPAIHGGSAYFDGTGDYLSVPSNNAFVFGTGDFTIESWIYLTSSSAGMIFGSHEVGVTTGYYFSLGTNLVYWGTYGYDGTNGDLTWSVTIPLGQWTHLAFVKSSSGVSLYVNGQLINTQAFSKNISSIPYNPSIGADRDGNEGVFTGYISDLRIVKGTAVYTANFTPPTQSLTAISGTSLLLKMGNAGIYDEMAKNNIQLIGNATTSTTQTKYNDTAIYFDGSDHLTVNHDALGTGNWTIEGWVYFNAIQLGTYIFDFRSSSNTNPALNLQTDWRYITDSDYRISSGITPSTNTWYHFAVVKNSGTTTLYINGSSIGTYADSLNYVGNTSAFIGRWHSSGAGYLNGYLEDFRITKGVARYTANFTPPTAPLGFSNAE